MTSREIAELTGKQHKNVLADIRKMLEDLDLSWAGFSAEYKDSMGRTLPCFNLPHRECMILVSGYSIPMRARIVDRWEALETGKAKPAMVAHPYSAAVEAIQVADALAKMLRLEGSAALGMARKATELTAPHLLPMVPVYAIDAPNGSASDIGSEATASLSALMKANDINGTAATMNVRLEMHGFLEKKIRASKSGDKSFWSVTEAGQKYGKNLTSPQNQRETQPHWYRDKFLDLMSTINAK
jgi:phage regulator Rha-like protein